MMDLYGVKSLIEDVEKAIENKEVKTLNRQQEKYLKDNYNSFVNFDYFKFLKLSCFLLSVASA